jgi:hypothetical protein
LGSGWIDDGQRPASGRDLTEIERGRTAYIKRIAKEKMILSFLEVGIWRSWMISAGMTERQMSRRLLMTAWAVHRLIYAKVVSVREELYARHFTDHRSGAVLR